MKTFYRLLFSVLALAPGLCERGATAEGDDVYKALRLARPEAPGVVVRDFALDRDAFHFKFESGTFYFLSEVEHRRPGAVFVGSGSVELKPASEVERRHLAFVTRETGLKSLVDRFDSAVLYFGDSTAEEIRSHGQNVEGAVDPRAEGALKTIQKRQRSDFRINFQVRLLRHLLNPVEARLEPFLALFEGKKASPALVAVDPGGVGWLVPGGLVDEGSALWVADEHVGGFWYLGALTGADPHPKPLGRALRYVVDLAIAKNSQIKGDASLRFEPLGALRVLPLQLDGKLRIQEVTFSEGEGEAAVWQPASVIQEAEKEDSGTAVVFPRVLAPGKPVVLRIRYEGKHVLEDVGDGNFIVGSRTSWYPNLRSFGDLSAFQLTYRVPKENEVVSVGLPVEDRKEGETRLQRFETPPVRVAGFNYGRFRKVERTDKTTGVKVTVFTNPGTPNVIEEINQALQGRGGGAIDSQLPPDLDNPMSSPGAPPGLKQITIDGAHLAETALADAINTARVGTRYFGPLGLDHVSVTQQSQWTFGQSWPSLIFLPYLASLDSTTRVELGLGHTLDFVDQVGSHEFAHQWWGHKVGWSSYRDQWLSEGFAEFTGALVLQHTGGMKAYDAFWEKARKSILGKSRGATVPNWQVGPMTLGWRLTTDRSPAAYGALVYSKGAYVLHMLRMMMRDPTASDPDASFIGAMKDFASTFAGKSPTTADFQAVLERHMVPNLNATHDGRLSWFFREWVDGTEIPLLKAKVDFKEEGGRYHVTGSVALSEVSPEFRILLPLYAEFSTGEISRLGTLPMAGPTTVPIDLTLSLAKKPKRIVVNALHDVLVRE